MVGWATLLPPGEEMSPGRCPLWCHHLSLITHSLLIIGLSGSSHTLWACREGVCHGGVAHPVCENAFTMRSSWPSNTLWARRGGGHYGSVTLVNWGVSPVGPGSPGHTPPDAASAPSTPGLFLAPFSAARTQHSIPAQPACPSGYGPHGLPLPWIPLHFACPKVGLCSPLASEAFLPFC